MTSYSKPTILDQIGTSHCVIEASAGTGKTYTLEHLVIQLILEGIPLESILVVTYTKKATLELIARVREKLQYVLDLETDELREGTSFWQIGDEQRTRLRSALASFDKASISTIHGFCQRVLQDSAFEGGRLFRQELSSTEDCFDKAFRELVRSTFSVQMGAVFKDALATFGTLNSFRKLLKEALPEYDALDLPDPTQANAAVDEFPEELAKQFIHQPDGTLRSLFIDAGVKNKRTLKAMADRLELILAGLQKVRETGHRESFWSDKFLVDQIRDYSTGFSEESLGGDARLLSQAYRRLQAISPKALFTAIFLRAVKERMDRNKREEGLFDFNDLIALVHAAVHSPDGETLVSRIRKRYQVALIDEFQDTDQKQWEVFRKIFLSPDSSHRLLVVGDPKQAIYSFRGGDLPTYRLATRAITARGKLDKNFRSTPDVIAAYNEIFRMDPEAPFFTGSNLDYYDSANDAVRYGNPRKLQFINARGEEMDAIRVVDVTDAKAGPAKRHAARALAVALKETLGQGRFGEEGKERPLLPEDVLVLTRTKKEGRIAARALRDVGIPSATYREEGLFDRPEAEACRDLLLAIASPYDESLRAKALLGPFFGLSFKGVEGCRELKDSHAIYIRLLRWRKLSEDGHFSEFFSRILSESGLSQRLLFLEEGCRTLTNIQHILDLLNREALSRHLTIHDLAVQVQRWIDGDDRPTVEESDTQRLERSSGVVQIITIHKAKGLEAPVVVLFGGISKAPASDIHRYHPGKEGPRKVILGSLSGDQDVKEQVRREEVEEGERLMYVALTRAMAQLILPRFVNEKSLDPTANYRCVNRRLLAILGTTEPVKATQKIRLHPFTPDANPDPVAAAVRRFSEWHPTLPPPLTQPDFRHLAIQGRPIWMFSYTGLHLGLKNLEGASSSQAPHNFEHRASSHVRVGPKGSAEFGSKVHAFLERVKLDTFLDRDFQAWRQEASIVELALILAEGEVRETVLAWAFQVMTSPLALPGGGSTVLARAARILREVDFLTPYPGYRDLLDGSIDLLFQEGERTYFLDWKTTDLPAYDEATMAEEVKAEYWIQIQIYTITTCRLLKIESEADYEKAFGGLIYVFLRGLPNGGIWTLRPSWNDYQAWVKAIEGLGHERLIPVSAGGVIHA